MKKKPSLTLNRLIYRLATEIIAYIAPQALEKDVEIELAPPPKEAMVLGNDTAIGILIRNVVDNAIRYTPPHGDVVSIIDTGKHIVFSVTDTAQASARIARTRLWTFYRVLGTKYQAVVWVWQSLTDHTSIMPKTLTTPSNGIGLQFDVAFPKLRA